jgi:DNA-binding MarR family transcriptional regulator
MRGSSRRAALLVRLDETLRKVGAHSVLLSDAVARLVGINSTDLECLDLLYLAGASTPGQLARHTGLTTGAMTAVIDRLERAGYVRRSRDGEDRRRVLVEALPNVMRCIGPLYERLASATARLNAGFDDRQLAVVDEYLSAAVDLVADHVAWLQTQRPIHGAPRRPRRQRGTSAVPRRPMPARTRPKRRGGGIRDAGASDG